MTTIAAAAAAAAAAAGEAEEAVRDNLRNPGGVPIGGAPQSWKLYDNPIYHGHHPHRRRRREHTGFPAHRQDNHARGRPISASRLAVSALFRPVETSASDAAAAAAASSELHLARAHIRELKAELGLERRLREKAEAVNRALALETSEERARSDRLAEEVARAKDEVQELRRAVDGERRRMRLADALREERLQMKLADARVLMEEKLLELRSSLQLAEEMAVPSMTGDLCRGSSVEEGGCAEGGGGGRGGAAVRRKRKEAENPHIRRGIKGFVEFPRSGRIRAGGRSGSRDGRADPGPKLECQMAQLRVLLKHRVGASGSANLVM